MAPPDERASPPRGRVTQAVLRIFPKAWATAGEARLARIGQSSQRSTRNRRTDLARAPSRRHATAYFALDAIRDFELSSSRRAAVRRRLLALKQEVEEPTERANLVRDV